MPVAIPQGFHIHPGDRHTSCEGWFAMTANCALREGRVKTLPYMAWLFYIPVVGRGLAPAAYGTNHNRRD